MPIPSSINDLSTTAGSNSPPGSESPSLIDNYLRTYASYIALLRDGMQNNSFRMAAAGGSANAITATYSPAVTTFVDGMTLLVKASAANTGAVTFSPNGLTAKPVVSTTHLALVGGEIAANGDVWLQYNSSIGGGSWVLIASTGMSRVVGTVSQVGGIPTGAIIERGSNANGEYVKYADGTMICTRTFTRTGFINTTSGAIFAAGPIASRPFPATFIVAPSIAIFGSGTGGGYCWTAANGFATTTDWPSYYVFSSGAQGPFNYSDYFIAIGRWF